MEDFIKFHIDKDYIVQVDRPSVDNIVTVRIPENILRSPKISKRVIGYEIIENTLIKRVVKSVKAAVPFNDNSITYQCEHYCVRLAFMFDLMFELNKSGLSLDIMNKTIRESSCNDKDLIELFDKPSEENSLKEDSLIKIMENVSNTLPSSVSEDIKPGYDEILALIQSKGIK